MKFAFLFRFCWSLLFVVLFSFLIVSESLATNLVNLSMEMETNQASTSGWAIITFDFSAALPPSGSFTVDLPTSPAAVTWDTNLAVGDVDVTYNASDVTLSAGSSAPSGTGKMAYDRTDGDTLTFYNNDTDTVPAGTTVVLELGDGSGAAGATSGRNAVNLPSTAATEASPYVAVITPSSGDSATKLAFVVVVDTTVLAQGVVPPHITMTLDDSDHSLGEIDETSLGSAVTLFTIDTNAPSGWELWYDATAFGNDDGNGIVINADTGDAAIAAGTENWGMNGVDNANPNVGTTASVTEAPGDTNTLTIEAYYDTADRFGIVSGADASTLGTRTKFASRSGSTDAQKLYVSFASAVDTSTPAGNYSAFVNFILIGKF